MSTPRVMSSAYMQWAKQHVHIDYNLAVRGITSYPLSLLPVHLEELEITGDSYYGYAPLQEMIASHCGVGTDRVFASIGTSLANHIAMAVLAGPGDDVLIEEPGYELIVAAAQFLGVNVRRFQRRAADDFRIDPAAVARELTPATKIVIVTNLHNPTSAVTSDETLREIGEAARRVGAKVLVDEVYLDALFDTPRRTAVHLGPEFVVTNSLTKIYGLSGLRCGWVLAEPELVRRMWHLNDLYEGIPPHATERMSVIAMRHLSEIRAWSRAIMGENRARARTALLGRDDLECFFPDYGTVVFPRLKRGSVDELCRTLEGRYRTAVVPGRFFGMPEHFRVGFGPKPEQFRPGLDNLLKALDELPR